MYKGYLGCKTQTLLQVIFRVNLVLVVFALSNPIHNHSFKNHHEIKRHLLLGKKTMIKLDNVLKSRNITLPTKICLVKATVFPVVTYGCDSWTIKKAEHWRIDDFELWCLRLLRVPWTARRSNQSILKEISPGCSLEGLMLKLKPQYFGPDAKNWLIWKNHDWERLKVGGKEEDRGWDGWMASSTQWAWVWVNSGSWWWTGRPGIAAVHGVAKSWTWLSDWTELNWSHPSILHMILL